MSRLMPLQTMLIGKTVSEVKKLLLMKEAFTDSELSSSVTIHVTDLQ